MLLLPSEALYLPYYQKFNKAYDKFLSQLAIYIRAGISIIKRFLKDTFFPLIDIILIFLGITFLKNSWENISIKIITP